MSKGLTRQGQDAKSRITKYLAGDKIQLNSEEEKILTRWEFAYDLMVAKEKNWVEIRDKIAFKFAVSKFTAENDISNTQEVFGTNRKINKRFVLHLHLDRMDVDIERIRKGLFFSKDEDGKLQPCTPDAKEIAALAKFAEAYTYTVNCIPDDVDRSKLPPPLFIFNLPEGAALVPPMTLEQALTKADEYIEFQDLSHEQSDIQPDGSTGSGEDPADPAHDDQVSSSE
ncbi:MAG: hypothetical protein ACTHMC_25215 [Pseudobacter sp.]|uniref:hypothetical protein n=1 Tax=Pseudobacter sp. TaxID=2045420 RepID=UPI003F81B060